ncbi:MAG: clostripain-related cysteine peptidase [Elusimicrobiaceae bacterium]
MRLLLSVLFIIAGGINVFAAESYPAGEVVASPASSALTREWTVMVFMNANNNLAKHVAADIEEMQSIGTTREAAVIAEVGMLGKPVTRYEIGFKKSKIIAQAPAISSDMGDYRHVAEFIRFCKMRYPAKRYMLVLWNHGTGVLDPQKRGMDPRGILFDDNSNNYVRTPQMRTIFEIAGPVDIYLSNACLMQMAEIGYEIKDYVHYMVGSEEIMLAPDIDYRALVSAVNSKLRDPRLVAGHIVSAYKETFSDPKILDYLKKAGLGVTISVLDLKKISKLPEYLFIWTSAVVAYRETAAISYAVKNAVRFNLSGNDTDRVMSPYVDLYDFVRAAALHTREPKVNEAARNLMNFITKELVVDNLSYSYIPPAERQARRQVYEQCRGVSIYMTLKNPQQSDFTELLMSSYDDLLFSKASGWSSFVKFCKSSL